MMTSMNPQKRYQIAKHTSYVNAALNTLLAVFKITVGWIGHSSALVADGIHSFSDLISDLLVLVAAKAGKKHPDAGHPYGHRRIETIAAIVIALLLLVAGIFIVADASQHLIHNTALYTPNIMVLIVAFISMAANEGLFRYTLKKGKAIHSNLVITNAWHNRSDVYTSLIVFISVSIAFFGFHYFDAIGAVIIALFILKISLKMVWHSINELLDAAVDPSTLETIHNTIETTAGVEAVHQLRTRQHGGSIFVDVHIQVPPMISVSEGHHISEQVALKLTQQLDTISDVTVHIDPEDDETSTPSQHLPNRPKLCKQLHAHWHTLPGYTSIKNLQLHYLEGYLHIDVVLPLHLLNTISAEQLQQRYQTACQTLSDIKKIQMYFT